MMTMMMATIEILLEVMLSLTVMLILMMMMMMMMMILLLLFLHHHPPVIMDPDDCPVAKAGGRVEVSPFLLIWITHPHTWRPCTTVVRLGSEFSVYDISTISSSR